MEQCANRRRFERIPANSAVLAERANTEPGGLFAVARDLGLGGCALDVASPIETGTRLKLYLSLGSEVVEADGLIVHERPVAEGRFRIGVEFLRMDAKNRKRYKLFLKHPSPVTYGSPGFD